MQLNIFPIFYSFTIFVTIVFASVMLVDVVNVSLGELALFNPAAATNNITTVQMAII